jgi:hypothetical protein
VCAGFRRVQDRYWLEFKSILWRRKSYISFGVQRKDFANERYRAQLRQALGNPIRNGVRSQRFVQRYCGQMIQESLRSRLRCISSVR